MKLLSILPFWMLYGLSWFLSLVLRLVGYRRGVIEANLERCFPQESPQWRRRCRRAFYRRLSDYFVEAVKTLSIAEADMRRRFVFENAELIDEAVDKGHNVAIFIGHCINWEWISTLPLWTKSFHYEDVKFFEIYHPLQNKRFDDLFIKLRSRFGVIPVKQRQTAQELIRCHRDGIISVTGFLADQRPTRFDKYCEVKFFGTDLLALEGTETLAKRLKMTSFFLEVRRQKRGYYRAVLHPLQGGEQPGELTQAYYSVLEASIRRDPPCYLWSHNRWKKFLKTK